MIKYIAWLFVWWGCCPPLASSAEPWQEIAYLQQAFEEVALRSEYVSAPQTVRKWRKPVKVWLVHHVDQAEEHATLARYHLEHLAKLTGHPVTMATSAAEANMTIVFSYLQLWRNDIALVSGNLKLKPPPDAACMFGLDLDESKAIRRAWVVIPVDHAQEHRLLLSCIVEETTQAMGLPNDSDKVYPSIFNDKTPETLLTGLDALLLKMLYSPKIKSGMRVGQVRPILADILQQWQADGEIDNAEKMVRQSPLYEMMGF
ncbi:DUF2927 domain-containing protein [Methylophilus aquaticus]|uniref:DUF2927 domain-containing protein n=1 Tax=Methylophilus aquaticus TaxID=1971610 RepID=A0ABT9JSL7_9PROT|nr:DUF2927 domain-containing protein [Methylophilus aquaticus]MDP8567516.1 DUF2927 domain-containing protein [Methylophilus aquaticus]